MCWSYCLSINVIFFFYLKTGDVSEIQEKKKSGKLLFSFTNLTRCEPQFSSAQEYLNYGHKHHQVKGCIFLALMVSPF